MPVATDTLFGASTFGADAGTTSKPRRAPRFGREVDANGQPKVWIANPSGLTLADVEAGLAQRVGRPVTVETVSSDPDEAIVVGTCSREPFTIRAMPGDDLPAVLRRLVTQLRTQLTTGQR